MSCRSPILERQRVIGTCIVSNIPYVFVYSYSQYGHEPENVRHYHYEFYKPEFFDAELMLCGYDPKDIHVIIPRGTYELLQTFGAMTHIEDVFLTRIESTMERIVVDNQYETE